MLNSGVFILTTDRKYEKRTLIRFFLKQKCIGPIATSAVVLDYVLGREADFLLDRSLGTPVSWGIALYRPRMLHYAPPNSSLRSIPITGRVSNVPERLSDSMVLGPSRVAANCAATRPLGNILWNPKVRYHVCKSPPLGPTLNGVNPVNTTPFYPI